MSMVECRTMGHLDLVQDMLGPNAEPWKLDKSYTFSGEPRRSSINDVVAIMVRKLAMTIVRNAEVS